MAEYEPNSFQALMDKPAKEESPEQIIFPNKRVSLIRVFVNLGPRSISYRRKDVLLVALNRENSQIKILFNVEHTVECATYRFDKTRIRFTHAFRRRLR